MIAFRSFPALTALAMALFSPACATTHPYTWADSVPADEVRSDPKIRAGDHIFVLVQGQESLTGELPVRPDGAIVHPLLGKVDVAGLTATEAQQAITARLTGVLENPKVTVAMVAIAPWRVSVVGQVTHPGPLEIDPKESVLEVLARAGGLTQFADGDSIYVVRRKPATRVRFRYDDLSGGDQRSLAFPLRDGDVVVVE